MKQRINLLASLPKFELRQFSMGMLLASNILLIVALLLLYAYFRSVVGDSSQVIAVLTRQKAVAQVKLNEIERASPKEKRDSELRQQVERLNSEISGKSSLVAILSSGQSQNTKGFSADLQAIADLIPVGVWLSAINIQRGGANIMLQGYALSTQQALEFATQLNSDKVFSGKSFKLSGLGKAAGGKYLNITLHSHLVKGTQ